MAADVSVSTRALLEDLATTISALLQRDKVGQSGDVSFGAELEAQLAAVQNELQGLSGTTVGGAGTVAAAGTGERGRLAFEAAKDPANWLTQMQVAELDRIPGYDIPLESQIAATHRQAKILGWSAEDVDAYYGVPLGTHAARFDGLGLEALAGDGKILTRYDDPTLFAEASWFSTQTYRDGQRVENPDGSVTVYRADGLGNVGGTTYNPDGTVRDPGGPRTTINQAIELQREPWLASRTGPAYSGSSADLLALADDTSGYTGASTYAEMALWLDQKGATLDKHFSSPSPAAGRSASETGVDDTEGKATVRSKA